ncbi:hypothetical protein D9619_012198 [Psilocybe cf. subviscida]|uniref:NodB homology domain-containing protein n=1 Tax=Psilocybe cf. subviscida TaxID=2480587 RepID=A0A8H5B7C8_9AGAR|nr:hypothetical protein D9619_012198 [Psilocybe cf. subviscida]
MFFKKSVAFLAVCLTFWGASAVPSGTTSPASTLERRAKATLYTKCTKANTVALTFDDGPWIYMNDIVNTLDAAGAKATFFFNGKNWGCIYDTDRAKGVKYAYDHGHQVASHTWAHKNLATLTWDQIHDEMWRVEQALVKITGAYPAFMRPPYGSYNDLVLEASGVRGQGVVIWDFDSGDSAGASATTSKNSYNTIANNHPNTILTLNHETYEQTAHNVLPYAVQRLKSAGYKLVTVAECLGKPAYQSVAAPQARDSTWKC